jgi:MFS family permease
MTQEKIQPEINPKTIQNYIDETPIWHDGTELSSIPMTRMQWRIWGLATAGKFFEGMIVFMTGIALPLMTLEFFLTSAQKGIIGASTLAGILFGATLLGGLSDRYGRKFMFIAEMLLFLVFLIILAVAPSYEWVVISTFGAGLALGCDYPTAHLVISDSIPSKDRGKLVLGAFAFQAVGALVGTAMAYLILYTTPEVESWRIMYAMAIVPTILIALGRFTISASPHWLASRGRYEEAEKELAKLLKRHPQYPKHFKITRYEEQTEVEHKKPKHGWRDLFGKHRRATIFASLPWFIQDLSTYGIGVFTPVILAATFGNKSHEVLTPTDVIHNDMMAAQGAAFIDVFFLIGIIFAIFWTDKFGRVKLQIYGFIGCAIGLAIAAAGQSMGNNIVLIYVGFILFNFMTNMGPNAQTYLIAGEVFPNKLRGLGAGFAASFAKVGAVLTTFMFPILIADIGTSALLYCLVVASLLGAFVTYFFRIETKGKNLEEI